MNNLKIKVNTESESKEAQELFFELGYKWNNLHGYFDLSKYTNIIRGHNTSEMTQSIESDILYKECKEITLPELRDLVVLKRNSIEDATHKGSITDNVYYVSSDEEVYRFESSAWCFSTVIVADLKPIEKKEMKEYLDPENNYRFNVTDKPFFDWIEIPEWAVAYADHKNGYGFFYDSFCKIASFYNIVWSRPTHPEELPFIDDEPLKVIDSEYSKDGNSVTHTVSLNDQYAEIETVRQTLKTRQSQYGSFEDVATATQDLLKILEKTGLKSLPSIHKEALHMICSKMVRIVNGDHNFIESWHDIAGYATLMENELRVTDGATNSRLTYQKVINGKLQDI